MRPKSPRTVVSISGAENSSSDVEGQEQFFVCTKCRCQSDKSLHRLLSEALLWRKEKAQLKELLRTTTNALEDKAFALTSYQASLADLLIAQTEKEDSKELEPIHMLALDLKERLSFSEMQMEILRGERDRSVQSLSELETKVGTCTSIAEEQSEFIRCQLTTIRKLEERVAHQQTLLEQAEATKNKEQKKLEEKLLLHQQRADFQEERLKQQIQENEVSRVEYSKLERRAAAVEQKLQKQMEMNEKTSKELEATKEELAQTEDKSAELREAQERMEQTWTDNSRLLQLLAASGMFKDLFDEMQDTNGTIYMPLAGKASKFQSLLQRYYSSNGRVVNPKLEVENWLPVEAFDIILDFRRQYCPSVPVAAINDLLAQLSYFWRELERRKMAQFKKRNEQALVDLKRQHSMSRQYDEVVGASFVKPVRLKRGQSKVWGSSISKPVYSKQRYSKVADDLTPEDVDHEQVDENLEVPAKGESSAE